MVKIIMPGRTRYPWFPRKRPGSPHWFRHDTRHYGADLHIELTGGLRGITAAGKAITCDSLEKLGRAPERISCRLGGSIASAQSMQLLAQPEVQAHYFSCNRWRPLRIQSMQVTHTCLHTAVLEHFDLQTAVARIVHRFLLCRGLTGTCQKHNGLPQRQMLASSAPRGNSATNSICSGDTLSHVQCA